tara:strand:+ start:555 stop:1346 length:792 start_codon:yes stop_codon:yes gene_type:complete
MKSKSFKLVKKYFNSPISCLTAYSPSVAEILDGVVDIILIGDSLGSTLYGMRNTRGVTLDMMKTHGRAVKKKISKSVTIIDMPYNTYETKEEALKNARDLLKHTKADMIKLEINRKKIEIVEYLNKNKVNVVSHIGVTPQSYSNFNKIKVLGKSDIDKKKLLSLAKQLESSGSAALLLECISLQSAKEITSNVKIPTIGIGASQFCDGQVLVFDDIINLSNNEKKPKFVKKYIDLKKLLKKAARDFKKDVKLKKFPSKRYSYL